MLGSIDWDCRLIAGNLLWVGDGYTAVNRLTWILCRMTASLIKFLCKCGVEANCASWPGCTICAYAVTAARTLEMGGVNRLQTSHEMLMSEQMHGLHHPVLNCHFLVESESRVP